MIAAANSTTGARDLEMTNILELHGAPSGNCIRAAIVLEEADLLYTIRFVDLATHEQKQSAHLALNPATKAPVLVEQTQDEAPFVATRSSSIVCYGGKAAGRLLPEDHRTRASLTTTGHSVDFDDDQPDRETDEKRCIGW
jgi:GST-like protein